jgi:hypothetical protein
VPANKQDRFGHGRYLLGLFLVGLVSGFLTCCTAPLYTAAPYTADSGGISTFGLTGSSLAGPVFGLAISLSLRLHKVLNSIWKLLGVIVASTLADFAAGFAGYLVYFSPRLHLDFERFGSLGDHAASLIAGGFIGGVILFPALWLLLGVHQNWPRFFLGFLICPLTGSALAILGWALAPLLGVVLWHILSLLRLDEDTAKIAQDSNYAAFYSLYVVWQSGMAVLLGVLLPGPPEEFGSPEKGQSLTLLRLSQ